MSDKGMQGYPDLTRGQRAVLIAAASLYAKHLSKLAEEARDLGKDKDAVAYETEAAGIKDDVLLKLEETTPQLRAHEVKAIEKGLTFFLKNLRAAKGTVRALGKSDLADQFEEEALEVERDVVPQFGEQVGMKGL